MLPDFFIAGAAKSGTTSLYHYLDKHPEVYMSPIKEPNHFCTDINPGDFSAEFRLHEKQKNLNLEKYLNGPMTEKHWGYFVQQKQDYEKLFKNRTTEKAAGEVSNSYLYSAVAAENIRREIPHAKIVIMLRNPADRAYSHYLANLRDGKTFLPFREELEKDSNKTSKGWGQSYLYLEMGFYSKQVKRYIDQFSEAQLRIYLYDDFVNDASGIMQDLFAFLGVSQQDPSKFDDRYNEAREPKSSRLIYFLSKTGLKKSIFHLLPEAMRKNVKSMFFTKTQPKPMEESDRKYLLDIYREDINTLQQLIRRDLSSWLA
jgi:hypothetical protein